MNLLRHISECGACARVNTRYFAVTEGGAEHCHHCDQDRGYDVSAPAIAQRSKRRHRRDRLKHNRAIQKQIPQGKRALQPWRGTCAAFFFQAILRFGDKSMMRWDPSI